MTKKLIINKSVLFVCELNAIRSPIAEYFVKFNYDCSNHLIDSCGFNVTYKDFLTIQVMNEIGINMEQHIPKNFNQINTETFDLFVSFSEKIYNFLTKKYQNKSKNIKLINIPIANINEGNREQKVFFYRIIREQIIKEIKSNFNKIFQ